MNFQEWYNNYEPRKFLAKESIAQDAWNACKEEVIRLLCSEDLDEYGDKAFKKIEKL